MSRSKVLLLAVFLIGLTVTMFDYHRRENADFEVMQRYSSGGLLHFSEQEAFQMESFSVEIEKDSAVPYEAEVYYTMDGSKPTHLSVKYEAPIPIAAAESVRVVPVKAAIYYNGNWSRVFTQTYFISGGIRKRYDTLVVSISGEPEDLFGYENGILVGGRRFAQAEGHLEEEMGWEGEANYNIEGLESEREIYVEIYDKNGIKLIGQQAGIRVSGGATRSFPQKSLKLYARKRYEEENSKFACELFPYEQTKEGNDIHRILKYDKLLLRNGGNDWNGTMIRWSVGSSLAKQAGFSSVTETRPAVVYLNGNYYGAAELQPVYSEYYLSELYHLPEDKIEIAGESESLASEIGGYKELIRSGIDSEEKKEQLEALIDVKQYLEYYALELFYNNADWPVNNYKIWRYTGEEEPGNPYTDGRWRCLLYDTDISFDFFQHDTDMFENLFENPGDNVIMISALLKVPAYREYFLGFLEEQLNTVLSPQNVQETIEIENNKLKNELEHILGETKIYGKMSAILSQREQSLEKMRSFGSRRAGEVRAFLKRYLDAGELHKSQEESIHRKGPVLSKVASRGKDEWIELFNPQEESIRIGGYYLSDDRANLNQYRIPDLVLKAGESIRFHGKNNPVLSAYLLNFGLKAGECLYLSDQNGQIIDSVYVFNMTEQEYYGRINSAGEWKYFIKEEFLD